MFICFLCANHSAKEKLRGVDNDTVGLQLGPGRRVLAETHSRSSFFFSLKSTPGVPVSCRDGYVLLCIYAWDSRAPRYPSFSMSIYIYMYICKDASSLYTLLSACGVYVDAYVYRESE